MMKTGKKYLILVAALLILTLSIGSAMAYFTAYSTTDGNAPLYVKPKTDIEEHFNSWKKSVTILNTSDEVDVYVRAKAFSTMPVSCEGTGWSAGSDDYYYYNAILGPKETTENPLIVTINGGKTPEEVPGDRFDVIVIYEAVPVHYDEDGKPLPADWTEEVVVVTEEGGNS